MIMAFFILNDYNVIFYEKKIIILYIMGYIWYQNFEFYSRNHFLKYFEK